MKAITSRDNPVFKRLKALSQSTREQRHSGQALLEGLHLASAWLDTGNQPAQCVITEEAWQDPEAQAILERIDSERLISLPEALFKQLMSVGSGAAMLMLIDHLQAPLPQQVSRTCVILDNLQDAGNVGSILRSAAAAGIREVFCTNGTAFAWSSKVLRSGMGAHFRLDIYESVAFEDLTERLQVPIAVTGSHDAEPVYQCDLTQAVAWVFGNEGAGVAAQWQAAARYRLVIPQSSAMESLNVAAAAAICLFEQTRQRASAV